MAKIYPTIAPNNFHGSQGEKQVYDALASLSNEYIVFYSYRWLGTIHQRRSEGEADFLVLHPKKGILSIEVKAGGISYHDGQWIQTNRNTGSQKVIDPLGQAMESQFRVREIIRNKYGTRYKVLVGRAAWFTSVYISDKVPLPAEANSDIILDQGALDFPKEALDKAFSYWQKNMGWEQNLSPADFKVIVKGLMPSFDIAETISSNFRTSEESYVQLTQRQGALLHFLQEQPMAAIHGPAGTGKTLLALQKVRMLAEEGEHVLYLCFNEFLLNYLRNSDYDREHITFHNIRTLAEELLQDDSLPISKVIPVFQEYFATEYNDDDWGYKNIVVDEGQDIDDSVLEHLAFLAELNEGIFYVFYDRNQYIMRREKPDWIEKNAECRLVLYKNCRNTSEIAATASALVDMKTKSYVNDVHGMKPEAEFCNDAVSLKRIAEKYVKEMIAQHIDVSDFVILTVRSTVKSLLTGVTSINGVPVSENREKGKIWFTSVRKFKGLEAKAVLLIDVNVSRLIDPLTQRVIYVGCSRANHYLKIALQENISKEKYAGIIQKLTDEPVEYSREGLLKVLQLKG